MMDEFAALLINLPLKTRSKYVEREKEIREKIRARKSQIDAVKRYR